MQLPFDAKLQLLAGSQRIASHAGALDMTPDQFVGVEVDITRPVRVDCGRIQQLAANLLSNALEHSAPAGKTKITATTTSGAFGLSVWNEGISIPSKKLGDAFVPFWRTEGAGRYEGLGLGASHQFSDREGPWWQAERCVQ